MRVWWRSCLQTFNSLYLGFLHESAVTWKTHDKRRARLSIPSTWDFSMNQNECENMSYRNYGYLSIPSTWDFSMNHQWESGWWSNKWYTFNSLYLGFLHESAKSEETMTLLFRPFNSLYLGFLHESQRDFKTEEEAKAYFQFPLLGISPWIEITITVTGTLPATLSIPSTWDFSMNPIFTFSWIVAVPHFFQFPLLGISPWISGRQAAARNHKARNFQFPLLGISPWIERVCLTSWGMRLGTFNSLYLGFLHESAHI